MYGILNAMTALINTVTSAVRGLMFRLATGLNILSGGHITPNRITLFGLLMHFPIAYLIALQYNATAALLLAIFGLFDALDGAMAKVQHKASNGGMLLDASTDRMKEVLLYCGAACAFVATNKGYFAAWSVAACGASLCVSYIKAKGETAVKDARLTPNEINRLFSDGIFQFQVRMVLLIVGLLTGRLAWAVVIVAVGSALTAVGRLYKISRKLG